VKKKKKKGHQTESGFEAPNLTALMDILSNIIFFLMASFGAQTLELTSASEISLPTSTSELSLKKAINVAVGMHDLYVEGQKIDVLVNGAFPSGTDQAVKLSEALRRLRAQRVAKNERPTDEDEIVLLVADKRVEYTTIDIVMRSCARAGFPKFRFVVSKS
jgi:biopolymer transport protein ExbD